MRQRNRAGLAGRSLLAAVLVAATAVPAAFSKDMHAHESRIRVKQAQCLLHRAGYAAVGPIDGIVGPRTRSAVTAFQRDHHLLATGRLNRRTLAALSGPMARRGVAAERKTR